MRLEKYALIQLIYIWFDLYFFFYKLNSWHIKFDDYFKLIDETNSLILFKQGNVFISFYKKITYTYLILYILYQLHVCMFISQLTFCRKDLIIGLIL